MSLLFIHSVYYQIIAAEWTLNMEEECNMRVCAPRQNQSC